jgi:1-acyl-sn-glycerol-3-phosphate acyltransferase
MSLLWLPINLLQVVFVTLWSLFCVLFALVLSGFGRSQRLGLWVAQSVWSPVLLASGAVRLDVRGLERIDLAQVYFVVANHQSWVDIPILLKVLPMPVLFIAKQELSSIPFLRHYIEAMGMVFVNRSDRRDSARSVAQLTDRLRAGWSVLSFPEGTRSVDGQLQRFRSGTFAAALETGVPVLPVALEGPARIVPRQGIRFRPGRVRVSIGPPIPTDGFSQDDRAELANRAQAAVGAELERGEG